MQKVKHKINNLTQDQNNAEVAGFRDAVLADAKADAPALQEYKRQKYVGQESGCLGKETFLLAQTMDAGPNGHAYGEEARQNVEYLVGRNVIGDENLRDVKVNDGKGDQEHGKEHVLDADAEELSGLLILSGDCLEAHGHVDAASQENLHL